MIYERFDLSCDSLKSIEKISYLDMVNWRGKYLPPEIGKVINILLFLLLFIIF
jgi:hypothetical protein